MQRLTMQVSILGLALALTQLTTSGLNAEAGAARYQAPARTIGQVAFAIGKSQPRLSQAEREALARVLRQVARQHSFDPLSGWAIIDHESSWRAGAVGSDGKDIGLAQIRYTSHSACQADRDSEACQKWRAALLDPLTNIRAMGRAITAWRKLCTEVTGSPPNMVNWLAGYGGYSRPSQGIYCGRKLIRTKQGSYWRELPVPGPVSDIVASRLAMLRLLKQQRVR